MAVFYFVRFFTSLPEIAIKIQGQRIWGWFKILYLAKSVQILLSTSGYDPIRIWIESVWNINDNIKNRLEKDGNEFEYPWPYQTIP